MKDSIKRAICDWIYTTATDEELTNFAEDVAQRQKSAQAAVERLTKLIGMDGPITIAPAVKPVEPVFAALPTDVPAENKVDLSMLQVPPGEAASKMSNDVREKIRSHLAIGPETISGLAQLLKRPKGATQSIMKLMHNRKEVIYDGEKYILRTQ